MHCGGQYVAVVVATIKIEVLYYTEFARRFTEFA